MKCDRSSPTLSAVLSLSRAERGSVTAEWALALPAVMVALGVVVSSGHAVSASGLLASETADAQRLVGLGIPLTDAQARIANAYGDGVRWQISRDSESSLVCVTLTRDHTLINGFGPSLELRSTRCGLDGDPTD